MRRRPRENGFWEIPVKHGNWKVETDDQKWTYSLKVFTMSYESEMKTVLSVPFPHSMKNRCMLLSEWILAKDILQDSWAEFFHQRLNIPTSALNLLPPKKQKIKQNIISNPYTIVPFGKQVLEVKGISGITFPTSE